MSAFLIVHGHSANQSTFDDVGKAWWLRRRRRRRHRWPTATSRYGCFGVTNSQRDIQHTLFGGHIMQTARYLIGITFLSGMFAYVLAGCAAEPHKGTEDPEIKTLPATSDEVIPTYGINFARFPTSNPINEDATLIDNNVPYARVNFGFDPRLSISKLLEPIDQGMNDAATNGIHIL
ncbi:MAG: hypothetical protein E6J91_20165, partial [Deltaproteobacteria bacterium]